MIAREETIVLRDAATVYAEGVIRGLERALSDLANRRSIQASLIEWRARHEAALAAEKGPSAGGGL